MKAAVGEITKRYGNKLTESGIVMKKNVIRAGVWKLVLATATVISGLPPLDCRLSPPRSFKSPSISDSFFQLKSENHE